MLLAALPPSFLRWGGQASRMQGPCPAVLGRGPHLAASRHSGQMGQHAVLPPAALLPRLRLHQLGVAALVQVWPEVQAALDEYVVGSEPGSTPEVWFTGHR